MNDSPFKNPFNVTATQYMMRQEFTDSFNKCLEEIRRDKLELLKWRFVAAKASVARADTDISTPEKFLTAQVDANIALLNRIDALEERLASARQVITDALCCAGIHGQHAPLCVGAEFARHNKHCPPSHPVWATAPKCNCWVAAAAEFLKTKLQQA